MDTSGFNRFKGMTEDSLRDLLENNTNLQERRQIRAALREAVGGSKSCNSSVSDRGPCVSSADLQLSKNSYNRNNSYETNAIFNQKYVKNINAPPSADRIPGNGVSSSKVNGHNSIVNNNCEDNGVVCSSNNIQVTIPRDKSSLEKMAAAATSSSRVIHSSSDLAPDKTTSRLSPATVGAFRVIRRSSRTMLSDDGLSGPSNTPSNTDSCTSTLFRSRYDRADSPDASIKGDTIGRLSAGSRSSPFSVKSGRSLSSSNIPHSSQDPHFQRPELQSRGSTYSVSSYFETPISFTNQASREARADGKSPERKTSSDVTSPSAYTSSSFASVLKVSNPDRRGSYSESSTSNPEVSASFSPKENETRKQSENRTTGDLPVIHPLVLHPEHSDKKSSKPQTPSDYTLSSYEKGQTEKASDALSALRERNQQLFLRFNTKSPVVSDTLTSAPLSEDSSDLHRTRESDNQKLIKETEIEERGRRDQKSPTNEQKKRSKFLSSLYSSQDKIKNFINKAGRESENDTLPSHNGAQSSISFTSNHSPSRGDSKLDTGVAGRNFFQNNIDEGCKPKASDTVFDNKTDCFFSASNLSSSDIKEDFIKIRDSGKAEPWVKDGQERAGSDGKLIQSPPGDLWGKFSSLSSADETRSSLGKEERYDVKVSETKSSSSGRKLSKDGSDSGSGPLSGRRFSNASDNDVFSPLALADRAEKSLRELRRHTSHDIFDFSKFSTASTSSSASSATPRKNSLGSPSSGATRPVSLRGERRRYSLPNTTSLTTQDIQEALRNASEIHERYTTGLFSPTERHPKLIQHSHVHRFLSDEASNRPALKTARPNSTSSDARKSREISLRQQLGSKTTMHKDTKSPTPSSTNEGTSSENKDFTSAKSDLKLSSFAFHVDSTHNKPKIDSKEMSAFGASVQESGSKEPNVYSGSRENKDYVTSRRTPSDAKDYRRVVVSKEGKSYSYIETCQSETELSQMLNTSEDFNERRRIRARMRELKVQQQNMGVDKGLSTPPNTPLGSIPKEYSPRISGTAGRRYSGVTSSEGSGSESRSDSVEGGNNYEDITSLSQLQKLLSEKSDPVERHKIRTVIRQLRQSTDAEQLKQARKQKTGQENESNGQKQQQNPKTESPPDGRQARSTFFLPLSKPDSITKPSLDERDRPGLLENVTSSNRLGDKVSSSSSSLSSASREENNLYNTSSTSNINNGFIHKPAPVISLTSNKSVQSEHLDNRRRNGLDTINNNTTSYTDSSVLKDVSHVSDDFVKHDAEKSTPDDKDNVSRVLDQAKARLKFRSDSLTSDRKSPTVFKYSSASDLKSQLTPDSAFKSDGHSAFHFPYTDSKTRSSSFTTDRSPSRTSDKASDKYREARQQILSSSDYSLDKSHKLIQRVSPTPQNRLVSSSSDIRSQADAETNVQVRPSSPERPQRKADAKYKQPSSPTKIPVLTARRGSSDGFYKGDRRDSKDKTDEANGENTEKRYQPDRRISKDGLKNDTPVETKGNKSLGTQIPTVIKGSYGSLSYNSFEKSKDNRRGSGSSGLPSSCSNEKPESTKYNSLDLRSSQSLRTAERHKEKSTGARLVSRTNSTRGLSDFEKIEKGQKPSSSKTFVSSLAAKFSEFKDDLDRGEENLTSSSLRRTQSLHSNINSPFPSDKKHVKFVLVGRSKGETPEAPNITQLQSNAIEVASKNEDSQKYQSLSLQSLTGSDVKPEEESHQNDQHISRFKDSQTLKNQGVDASASETSVCETGTDVETVELKKSTLKRSKPVGRSLTESTLNRPERFRSNLELKQLKNPDEQRGEQTVESNATTRYRKFGIITSNSPLVSKFDLNQSKNRKEGANFEGNHVNVEHTGSSSKFYEKYSEDRAKTSERFEGKADSIVKDFDKIKSPTNQTTPAKVKRFSVPAFGNYVTKPSPQIARVKDTGSSSVPFRRHSEIYNKHTAAKMEQAFTNLLEDLDKVSGSEGNPSDLELSDSEELLTQISVSNGGLNNEDLSRSEQKSSDIRHFDNVDSAPNGLKGSIDNTSDTLTPKYENHENRFSKDNSKVSSALVDNTGYSHKKDTDNEIRDDSDDMVIPNTGVTTTSVYSRSLSTSDTWSKEDSGIGLGVEDTLQQSSEKVDVKGPNQLSSPSLSTSTSAPSSSSKTVGGVEKVDQQPEEKLRTVTKPKTMDSNSNFDNFRVGDDMDEPKTYTSTSTKIIPSPRNTNTNNFVGTRTFNVAEDEDGSVTMQAIAEDQNQNRIVTVRTKKQRTPSNADEEMRDTIVEKKILSPSGSVFEERDVIQTKKRLTSRGSNYYSRSTYTTRTRRDREGSERIEHDVCVESDNKSVSQGQSWGDRAETRVILDDAHNANVLQQSPSPLALVDGSENISDNSNQNENKPSEEKKSGSQLLGVTGRMDMSKASSGYGSVSGSEEDDANKGETTPSKPEGPPEIVQTLKDVMVTEGKQIVLECTIESALDTEVTWFKDDDEVCESDNYVCRFDADTGKASLTVEDATLFDTALFSCFCRNEVGEARTRCRVNVKKKPEHPPIFEKGLSDVVVVEGHSTILSCTISEAASVAWYKDGIVQRNSPDFKQTFDGREARLEIGEVFLDDVGDYACVAKNEAGERRSSCRLSVNASDNETTVVPMFLTKLPNKVVNNGESLTLECDVIGSPEPSVDWLKDGEEISRDISSCTSYDGRVACLQIDSMRVEDAGCYQCVAENPAGRVSMDANVTVQVKSKAPNFILRLEDISTSVGKSVVLKCELTGTPQPSVLWRKDGMIVGAFHNFIQSCNNGVARLEILGISLRDSGSYECVAKNSVAEISCSCKVEVVDPKASKQRETKGPQEEQISAPPPRVTTRRTFKKLSEPRPSDIITAVLQRASTQGIQRAQSFSPNSSAVSESRARLGGRLSSPLASNGDSSGSQQTEDMTVSHAPQRPETLRVVRDSICVSPRSESSVSSYTSAASDSPSPRMDNSTPSSARSDNSVVSQSGSVRLSQLRSSSPSTKGTNLGRSVSMHIVSNNNFLSPGSENGRSPSPSDIRPRWIPPSQENPESRETTMITSSNVTNDELRPSTGISGYRPVSPLVLPSPDNERISPSPLARSTNDIGNGYNQRNETYSKEETANDQSSLKPFGSSQSLSVSHASNSEDNKTNAIPSSSTYSSDLSTPASSLPSSTSSSSLRIDEVSPRLSQSKTPSPRVSELRLQFLKNDQSAADGQQKKPFGSSGGGVRRWHSLPPQEKKPEVFKREPSALASTNLTRMSSYDHITDEEELHKLMNSAEDFDERKKIRARLREIRDKQREDYEAKRKQREAEAEDLVKKKFERAEAEKKKKMEAYKHQAPTCERDSKYHTVTQHIIEDTHKQADEEKAKKLAAYSQISSAKNTSSTSTTKTPGGGTRTTTTKTTTETSTKSFGGTSYGKPAEMAARELTDQLMRSSGSGVSGQITVRTETWNSADGRTERSEKSQSWGAKPQGAKSAMAAFKQMDTTNNPNAGAAKPKALARSPTAIKQILLDWTKAMTQGYSGVEVTNFSSSWNNGMAFCALIHHFYPNAFDFSKLDPKQRRYNFTLAFDTAEKEADIAPLLDVDDMVKMKNPDWKCVFTYVQSIYRHLRDHENNKVITAEQ